VVSIGRWYADDHSPVGPATGDILPRSTGCEYRRTEAMAIDPVCGMEVEISTTPPALTFEHDGTTYYFCSRGCLLEFEEDPEKYLDPDYVPSM
jgi:YHS domain-containing protein